MLVAQLSVVIAPVRFLETRVWVPASTQLIKADGPLDLPRCVKGLCPLGR
jgi:hypothetical protein